jgi:hypothetical protein
MAAHLQDIPHSSPKKWHLPGMMAGSFEQGIFGLAENTRGNPKVWDYFSSSEIWIQDVNPTRSQG